MSREETPAALAKAGRFGAAVSLASAAFAASSARLTQSRAPRPSTLAGPCGAAAGQVGAGLHPFIASASSQERRWRVQDKVTHSGQKRPAATPSIAVGTTIREEVTDAPGSCARRGLACGPPFRFARPGRRPPVGRRLADLPDRQPGRGRRAASPRAGETAAELAALRAAGADRGPTSRGACAGGRPAGPCTSGIRRRSPR